MLIRLILILSVSLYTYALDIDQKLSLVKEVYQLSHKECKKASKEKQKKS